jgi:hypothetical protein
MTRETLEQLETSDLDLGVTLAWLVRDRVPIPAAELNAALRRAVTVLAAGGDPQRELDPDGVAAARLADELDAAERRAALADALAALDTRNLPRDAETVQTLRSDPETAWKTLALALLADELAD